MAQHSLGEHRLQQPMCERRINLPSVSGNALIYEIHMVTQPRPQPPQIPQACWRLRLEPGGGSTLAQTRHSFTHGLAGDPGRGRQRGRDPESLQFPPWQASAALATLPSSSWETVRAAVLAISHRMTCPASSRERLGSEPKQSGENLAVTMQPGAGDAQLLIKNRGWEERPLLGKKGVPKTSSVGVSE